MLQKFNMAATKQLLRWEYLLQESMVDILIEAFEFIF